MNGRGRGVCVVFSLFSTTSVAMLALILAVFLIYLFRLSVRSSPGGDLAPLDQPVSHHGGEQQGETELSQASGRGDRGTRLRPSNNSPGKFFPSPRERLAENATRLPCNSDQRANELVATRAAPDPDEIERGS